MWVWKKICLRKESLTGCILCSSFWGPHTRSLLAPCCLSCNLLPDIQPTKWSLFPSTWQWLWKGCWWGSVEVFVSLFRWLSAAAGMLTECILKSYWSEIIPRNTYVYYVYSHTSGSRSKSCLRPSQNFSQEKGGYGVLAFWPYLFEGIKSNSVIRWCLSDHWDPQYLVI